jgi:hypothetical protein
MIDDYGEQAGVDGSEAEASCYGGGDDAHCGGGDAVVQADSDFAGGGGGWGGAQRRRIYGTERVVSTRLALRLVIQFV